MFTLGEKYIVISPFSFEGKDFSTTDEFKVVNLRNERTVSCEFVRDIGGHTGGGEGKRRHCWNIPVGLLEDNTRLANLVVTWEL